MNGLDYEYRFEFKKGRVETYTVRLGAASLTPLNPLPDPLPEWTALEFHRCEGCPLPSANHSHCPLAARISPLVEQMGDVVSFDEVNVTFTVDERVVSREATAQEGISSLMGIVVATSGCPLTAFFKPMARFHLPFANVEETFYRAASMYMLGQYYRWQSGLSADLDMVGLKRFYEGVAKVNKYMALRLKAKPRQDGPINALVLLDMFVKSMPHEIDVTLKELAPLFGPYLAERRID